MNCHSCQKLLLLTLSREANAWQRVRVERHLRNCPVCRRFREATIETERAMRAHQPAPSADTVETVLSYARRELIRRQTARSTQTDPLATFRPAWFYAAASVLVLVGFILIMEPLFRSHPADIARIPDSAVRPTTAPAAGPEPAGSDLDQYMDELAWQLEATYADIFFTDQRDEITWQATEQLAAQLLTWEDADT